MNRKAIYLDANADLATALSKLALMTAPEVVLVVPKGSVLFHSAVNLKILKSESASRGQSLALVTMDARGRDLAARSGITVYKELTQTEGEVPPAKLPSGTDRRADLAPAQSEVKIKYKRKLPQSQSVSEMEIEVNQEPPTASGLGPDLKPRDPGWSRNGLMVVFIAVALLILGGVVYFVLPRATVQLDIRSEPFNHRFKLILADKDDLNAAGQNVFKGRFVEVTEEIVQTFPATGIKNEGEPASGIVIIYNYTKTLKGLIPETRFVSPTGLVFRISEDVLIAPARAGSDGRLIPGRTKARVTADEGGTDGNLPAGTKFTVPGLGSVGIDLVYGQNQEPFSSGSDQEIKIVSDEDIESARESVSKNIFLDTETQLQDQVSNNEELIVPLIQNDIIDSVPSVAAGATRGTFDLKVQVRSWTLLPDTDKLGSIVENTLITLIPRNRSLTPQTLKGARIVMDNADFLLHTIDFTVEVDGLIATKIDSADLAGSIANRTLESVEKLLDSVPDIVSHKIVLWPFWVARLPLLESNITLEFSYIS